MNVNIINARARACDTRENIVLSDVYVKQKFQRIQSLFLPAASNLLPTILTNARSLRWILRGKPIYFSTVDKISQLSKYLLRFAKIADSYIERKHFQLFLDKIYLNNIHTTYNLKHTNCKKRLLI